MDEEWRDIAGYEGYYQVSNWGRVRSLTRKIGDRYHNGMVLKEHLVGSGYHSVTLCDRDRNRQSRYVHQLVLEAFVGPRPAGKTEVNHKDGNKTNNVLPNLEYVTKSENNLHRVHVLGIQVVRGSKNGASKLTEEQVVEMRQLYAAGQTSHRKLAKLYGLHYSTIARIVEGHSWSWLK